jgi:hypothetical protein
MDLSQITTLYGRSIHDPLVEKAMAEWDTHEEDKGGLGLPRYVVLDSRTYGVTFAFWYKGYYAEQIAPPKSTFKGDDEEEVILSEMTFRRKKLKDVSLPYGLHFGDSPTAIQQTLGCKPFSKSKNYAGEPFWTFYDDNFELMIVFNKAGTLEWFRIWALHESSRKKKELLENIKGQSRNITPDRAEAIEKLKGKMPTRKWTRRMREGDHEFTAKALEESSGLLSSFIDTVAKATKKRNATSIYSALKKAVTGFNKLSKKHGGFIETLERDELVGFLQDAIALSGFVIEAGVDLTQEYRTW